MEKKPQQKIFPKNPLPNKEEIVKYEHMLTVVTRVLRELNYEGERVALFLIKTDGSRIEVTFSDAILWNSDKTFEACKDINFGEDDTKPFKKYLEDAACYYVKALLSSRKMFMDRFADDVISTFVEMFGASEGKADGK